VSDQLKPCPFCGSGEVNNTTEPVADINGTYQWICPDCICFGPAAKSVEDASFLWGLTRKAEQKIIDELHK